MNKFKSILMDKKLFLINLQIGKIVRVIKKLVPIKEKNKVLFAKTYIVKSDKDGSIKELYQPDIELISMN